MGAGDAAARGQRDGNTALTRQAHEWSEEREERFRQLWADGVPVTQIGLELGVSRNAVVGKRKRMDLPERGSPLMPKGSGRRTYNRSPQPRPPQLPLPALASLAAWTRAPVIAPVPVRIAPRRAQVAQRACGECQWPVSGTRRAWVFCGAPCVLDARGLPSPYCRPHLRLATVGVPAVRSEAA